MNDLKDELAAHIRAVTPDTPPPYGAVIARRRQLHRRRVIHLAFVVVAVVGIGGAVVSQLPVSSDAPTSIRSPEQEVANQPAKPPSRPAGGEVPFHGSFACTPTYSPEALIQAQYALDGTIRSVAPAPHSLPQDESQGVRTVTLSVEHWFFSAEPKTQTAVVLMRSPAMVDGHPSYKSGDRLLVSGDGARGGSLRAWPCGFTRYYDPGTAEAWAAAGKAVP